MKQETNKPLYQILNEERTQGQWVQDDILGGTFGYEVVDSSGNTIGDFFKNSYYRKRITGRKIGQSNARYTALAVNNLHHLAEALETIIERLHTNWDAITSGGQKGILTALTKEGKEALSRIS